MTRRFTVCNWLQGALGRPRTGDLYSGSGIPVPRFLECGRGVEVDPIDPLLEERFDLRRHADGIRLHPGPL
jgi:hypothetical protein